MYSKDNEKQIYKQAVSAIQGDDNILFMDDVIAALPVCKPTFYKWFPKGSAEYEHLWDLLNLNRIKVKKIIRAKLRKSGKAAELLSLYRMICTEEERRAINQNYLDVKADVDNKIEIGFVETGIEPVNSEEDIT